ncbi:MAG: hypothetical protein GYB66_09190 [Chloroflexi bacterium]|nr:hypothetical protein [Chloroflexota bacterium]
MTVQYEALVGHLLIVGGRPMASVPPGARVQPAPRRAHRSREQDTLFVLITSAGKTKPVAEFLEKLAKLATDAYFASRLGVTGALREAGAALNTHIQSLNQQQATDFRAGALMLVKRGDNVYLVRSGTTLCAARLRGHYTTFPSDPDMLNMLPLGARSEPVLEFTHFRLSPNDIFVLGDAGIAALNDRLLKQALNQPDVEAVLEKLEGAVENQAFASVIQFIDANAPPPEAATASPMPDESVAEDATEEASASPQTAPVADAQPVPATSTAPPPAEEAIASVESPVADTEDATGNSAAEAAQASVAPAQRIRRKSRSNTAQTVAHAAEDGATAKRQSFFEAVAASIMLFLSNILRGISNGISAILDRLLPAPEQDQKNQQLVPLNVVALIAVIIPAVIGVVVVGVAISNRDTTRFEELRSEMNAALEDARALEEASGVSDKDKRNAWLEVRNWAERARQENPDSSEAREVILDAQNYIDSYDRINRVDLTLLREYQASADLRGPILAPNGKDIYTLDRNRSQVFRDELDGSGQRLITVSETPVIERARPINEYLVSNLVDIEWMDEGGAAERNALIALDDNGLLISYHGTFGLSALQLNLPPDWNRPEAIATWGNNFYVLDAGANQIWRFRPENGFYQSPPEEYFQGNNRPDLGAAVDFAIDADGLVYILFDDGTISKYRGGEPSVFELNEDRAPVDGINNGYALFISNDPRAYAIFVADRENDAIYQISLGGTVNGGYRPRDILSPAFDSLSGVYADVARGNVYILSGNTLYRVPFLN